MQVFRLKYIFGLCFIFDLGTNNFTYEIAVFGD